MYGTHIVIDCDPGTDDALALLVATVHFKHRLLCIISTYGNSSLEHTHSNLEGLAQLMYLHSAPILRGSECPMGKDTFVPTDYHGENGLCGITLESVEHSADTGDEIETLYDLICESGKVSYLALGPLTNLARLLERHPDAAERISEVVMMGGGFAIGNTDCGAEYNFSLDPRAVKIVLESPIKKFLAPLDFTHTLVASEDDVRYMTGAPKEEVIKDRYEMYDVLGRILYANLDTALKNGNEGAILHDAATAMFLVCPEKCRLKDMRIRSDEMGRLFPDGHGHEISVIETMDRRIFFLLMNHAFGAVT